MTVLIDLIYKVSLSTWSFCLDNFSINLSATLIYIIKSNLLEQMASYEQPCAVGGSLVLETNLAPFASQCSSWRLFPGLTVLKGEHESTVSNIAGRWLPVEMDGGYNPKQIPLLRWFIMVEILVILGRLVIL